MKKTLYVFLQCTWGFLQSLMGFLYMLRYAKCRHEWYHGSYVTYFDAWGGGISLGMFVFVAENNEKIREIHRKKGNVFDEKRQKAILVHEYGHTIQSLILGPLYLFIIGIPSMTWASFKPLVEYRKRTGVKYTSFYPERWANRLGEWVTKEVAIDN
ncbi:MAG: hypothetical protein PUK83_05000 [Clostridia bacterium]|nr:hypothetical protein [Clostridia bacterium]MDY5264158.1 hypothetical protein [Eubacteriales bacterium]